MVQIIEKMNTPILPTGKSPYTRSSEWEVIVAVVSP